MLRARYLVAGAALAALSISACGGSAARSTGADPPAATTASAVVLKLAKVAVSSGSTSRKESILVNSSGRSVYLLTGDSAKHPECTSGSCLGSWPAVTTSAAKPRVGSGVTGKVEIWRHGGIRQLTIDGHPLYTYAGDPQAGVANGEGVVSFGGTWKVLSGSGSATPAATAASSGGTAGSYGATAGSGTKTSSGAGW